MITAAGLTFTYPGAASPAIQDLAFAVQPGEVFGFLGPSGAGKSTTQNILIGLLRGWRGEVEVAGKPLGAWGPEYYRTIGVSFEFPNHYLKLTARENLEYFRSLYGPDTASVSEVLALVELADHADKRVGEFSKGMKARLNFARSLLHRPRLWFLDEPTTGLDPVNAVRIREIIREHQGRGVTTLLTTHDMVTAEAVCDRVAFIVDGRIAAIDSPAALRQRYGKRVVEVSRTDASGAVSVLPFAMDGLAANPSFLDALADPTLTAVHSQEATLEDVFVEVTGRTLQ
ncbi:MAG: ABC transporter ATP-binding protein [Gemmatimonadota bacterium]|nr:ABC transporter ATP-binding protein [Gemmatimonadota bacterium]